jgi:hypothetical protein
MLYKDISHLSDAKFKRLTGVVRPVFNQMLEAITAFLAAQRKHDGKGRPAKLTPADKLLLLLMYYREYRTMFHIATAYSISESRVCEIIREYEGVLIKAPRVHLPGKKKLLSADNPIEVVIVDITESPVERPKKNNESIIQARKNDTPKSRK